jgi:hypothetical protein
VPRSKVLYAVSWTSACLNRYSAAGRRAALKDQAGFDEAAQGLSQFGLGERRGCCKQLIGKVAPDGGADLRRILCRRTEPVEAPQQRGVQSGRRHSRYRQIATIGAGLDHRLGQLPDKERHTVGALDDLVDNIRGSHPTLPASRFTSVAPSLRPSRSSAITVTCDWRTQGGWNSGR